LEGLAAEEADRRVGHEIDGMAPMERESIIGQDGPGDNTLGDNGETFGETLEFAVGNFTGRGFKISDIKGHGARSPCVPDDGDSIILRERERSVHRAEGGVDGERR
jgi:hypothetical protein